ncbi:putative aminopeptidase [Roseimicrobium gellanilyticum]|uniref:Putative aminopeptidase n=2 Tax=Roseimicrobium gellanilyticum TaxID=748857 RepID=A0A366HTF8_9BACT|nr:putative aminopeptidase [Roseimicrobium gellanilyticum]
MQHAVCLTLSLVLLAAVITITVSCSSSHFYSQAAQGQADMLRRARPIPKVLADPKTNAKLRSQLELVQELRTFAHDQLKLPTNKQYKNYADLGRKFAVWNVYAAPEFSLKAKTWRYPVVGSLKYRGFFSESAAKEEAEELREDGYDVMVGGVRVYSTLGWFSDPVLNTFVNDKESQLAETLFHELTHARFFVSGDTDFNEAYATASGQEGVRQWLRSKGDTEGLKKYEADLLEFGRILALLRSTRAKLEALYAQEDNLSEKDMRLRKTAVFDETRAEYEAMKRRGECDSSYDRLFGTQLNNARLTALATYYDLVPAFHRLYEEQGRDWEKFHQAVEAMKPLTKKGRREKLGMPATE